MAERMPDEHPGSMQMQLTRTPRTDEPLPAQSRALDRIVVVTTDERLDRLTERHQVLGESLQLLTADVQGLAQTVRELAQSAKEHDRVLRGHADLISDLVKVATAHERRLQRLEGAPS